MLTYGEPINPLQEKVLAHTSYKTSIPREGKM
jgi:hypothetical protein